MKATLAISHSLKKKLTPIFFLVAFLVYIDFQPQRLLMSTVIIIGLLYLARFPFVLQTSKNNLLSQMINEKFSCPFSKLQLYRIQDSIINYSNFHKP